MTITTMGLNSCYLFPMSRPHALLVDDDLSNRDIIASRLEVMGFDITALADPMRTRPLLEQGVHFDLAVLDQRMPGMTGEELAAVIRATFKYRHLPILLVTADPSIRVEGAVDHVLYKPFTRHQLQQAVAHVMQPGPRHPWP